MSAIIEGHTNAFGEKTLVLKQEFDKIMCGVIEKGQIAKKKKSMRECNSQDLFPVEHACVDG